VRIPGGAGRRVWGSGSRVRSPQGLGFRVKSVECRDLRVQGLRFEFNRG